jgi:hypothetical protein
MRRYSNIHDKISQISPDIACLLQNLLFEVGYRIALFIIYGLSIGLCVFRIFYSFCLCDYRSLYLAPPTQLKFFRTKVDIFV